MRKIVSILLVFLMMLQAIPVLHFFSSHKEVFYAYIDEEKPEQKSKVEKKEYNKDVAVMHYLSNETTSTSSFLPFVEEKLSSPSIEFLTPPPNFC